MRPSHRNAARSAWSAWRAPCMPSVALPHWRPSLESWSPQSSTTSGGEPGPREVRENPSKLIWGWGDPSSRESCGEGTVDWPCTAQFFLVCLARSRFAHRAPHPTVESQACPSQELPKLRAQTHGNRPRRVEGALKKQPGLSSPLRPGDSGWRPGLRRSWTPTSQSNHFPCWPFLGVEGRGCRAWGTR